MKLRYIPNILTGFRILLVPAVVMLMLEDEFLPALVLFAVAGFSDAVDGYLGIVTVGPPEFELELGPTTQGIAADGEGQ